MICKQYYLKRRASFKIRVKYVIDNVLVCINLLWQKFKDIKRSWLNIGKILNEKLSQSLIDTSFKNLGSLIGIQPRKSDYFHYFH